MANRCKNVVLWGGKGGDAAFGKSCGWNSSPGRQGLCVRGSKDAGIAHVYARFRINVCKTLHQRMQDLAQAHAKRLCGGMAAPVSASPDRSWQAYKKRGLSQSWQGLDLWYLSVLFHLFSGEGCSSSEEDGRDCASWFSWLISSLGLIWNSLMKHRVKYFGSLNPAA